MFEINRLGFVLFGLDIRWYGVLIGIGMLLGLLLTHAREKRLGLPKDASINIALFALPSAIVFARAYYVLFSWDYYASHPEHILMISEGGLAIYGGVIGGIAAGWLVSRAKKYPFAKCLDLFAPAIALGQAIGRWGNFINQEAYGGRVTDAAWQFFPASVYIPGSGWHLATFFYESIWCALIVLALLLLERRGKFKRSGDGFQLYLMLYCLERSFVEGLREDSLYIGSLRVSQILSLAVVLVVCILLLARMKGQKLIFRILPLVFFLVYALLLAYDMPLLALPCMLVMLLETAHTYVLYINKNE